MGLIQKLPTQDRTVESVQGGHHKAENRRRLDAYTDALVESVREGHRKIDDGCKEKASRVHSSLFTSQDKPQTQEKCTRPFEDRGREGGQGCGSGGGT